MPYLKLEGNTEEICNNIYRKFKTKKMMKNKIITLIIVAFATITNAQNYFKAKVLDSESNEALIGATLLLKGTNNGVSTWTYYNMETKHHVAYKNVISNGLVL